MALCTPKEFAAENPAAAYWKPSVSTRSPMAGRSMNFLIETRRYRRAAAILFTPKRPVQ